MGRHPAKRQARHSPSCLQGWVRPPVYGLYQRWHARGVTIALPRRWVVERTLAWITSYRRCARDYERLPAHHEAMILWAMITLMTRRLAAPDEVVKQALSLFFNLRVRVGL